MSKLSKKTIQHLHNAKALVGSKLESWTGREPFPGDPERLYKAMIADVNYELHEYETVETQPEMSPHLVGVLKEYRTILEDTILFWTNRDSATAETYEAVMKDLDSLLEATEVADGPSVPPVARRPNVRCVEFGRCKIKVENEQSRSSSPTQGTDGQWMFDDPEVYRQNRECQTCGRQWTTSVNHGKIITLETKVATRIML